MADLGNTRVFGDLTVSNKLRVLDLARPDNTPVVWGDRTITAGAGLSGGGTLGGNITLSHSDTSSQLNINNSGRTYIQSIELDTYGHITGIVSATETVVNTHRAITDSPASGVSGTSISSGWAYSHAGGTGNEKHVPSTGSAGQFLAYDGNWAVPPNDNTTYTSASFTHSGLTGTHNLTTDLKPTWGNVSGKPSFATVATSGSYSDLSGKPSIAYASAIPADAFTTEEVNNLRAGKLDDGSTPWTSKLDASTYTSHANNASAHHTRYTNSEAVAAVNAQSSMSINITGSSASCTGNAATATNATTHIASNGSDHSYINQSVTTSATPQFTRLGLGVVAGSTSPLTLKINNANEFPSGMIALENAAAGEASIRFNSASTGTNSWYLGLNQGADFKLGYSTSFTDGAVQLGISTSGAVSATSFNGITGLATASPSAHGTAAVGTSAKAAREDHVHPSNNTTYSVGNGLTSSGTVFSLGTPSTITGTTLDEATSISHTHSVSLKHSDLGSIGASDHHTRYSDSEAVAAVNAQTSMSINISGSSASCTGNANSATNIAGGVIGSIPYQTAANKTALLPKGTAGYVLTMGTSNIPSWVENSGGTISAGKGMNFTSSNKDVTITLGTPTTLTASTLDEATSNSHTHAITATDSGAVSTIVKTDSSGNLTAKDTFNYGAVASMVYNPITKSIDFNFA